MKREEPSFDKYVHHHIFILTQYKIRSFFSRPEQNCGVQSDRSATHSRHQVVQKWKRNQGLYNNSMFSLEIRLLICALFFKRISFKTNIRIFIWIFLWNYYFELISIMCMPFPLELCSAIKVYKKAGGESQTAIALFQTLSFTFQTEFHRQADFFPFKF